MFSKKILIVSFALGLFLLSLTTTPVAASVEGQTYFYHATFIRESTQVDDDPEYGYTTEGDFRVQVWNVSQSGGDDVINYNYQGYVI